MNSDHLNLLQPVVPADSVTACNGPGMEQRAVPAEGVGPNVIEAKGCFCLMVFGYVLIIGKLRPTPGGNAEVSDGGPLTHESPAAQSRRSLH